jgi:hypothetical protein
MKNYVAEFIGTFPASDHWVPAAVGPGRVDPARHSVDVCERDDVCGSRAHHSKTAT